MSLVDSEKNSKIKELDKIRMKLETDLSRCTAEKDRSQRDLNESQELLAKRQQKLTEMESLNFQLS